VLSLTAKYALRATYLLTGLKDDECMLAREIAKRTQIPKAYLARILSTMAKRGILHSRTGIGGGFCIKRDSLNATLYDIAVLFDEPDGHDTCLFGFKPVCSANFCPMHERWVELDRHALELLKSTTLHWLKSSKSAFDWNRIYN